MTPCNNGTSWWKFIICNSILIHIYIHILEYTFILLFYISLLLSNIIIVYCLILFYIILCTYVQNVEWFFFFFECHKYYTLQEGTQVPVTHIGQSHPAKTFNGSHPLNVFAEQLILNACKGSGCQKHCQISEKRSHKHSVRL